MTITQLDGPTGRSPSGSNGALAAGSSAEQLNDTKNGDVRKLEEHRRLMLQHQLAGRKWDSVEQVERITRRAASEDRTITATTNTEMIIQKVERARRSSEVAILSRSSQYETAVQRSTSPPSTYHSLTWVYISTFLSLVHRVLLSNLITGNQTVLLYRPDQNDDLVNNSSSLVTTSWRTSTLSCTAHWMHHSLLTITCRGRCTYARNYSLHRRIRFRIRLPCTSSSVRWCTTLTTRLA